MMTFSQENSNTWAEGCFNLFFQQDNFKERVNRAKTIEMTLIKALKTENEELIFILIPILQCR